MAGHPHLDGPPVRRLLDRVVEQVEQQSAEQISLASNQAPVASTMGQTDPVDAEVIRLIQPDGFNFGKVRLTADIRFEGSDPGLPSEDALFTDMLSFS